MGRGREFQARINKQVIAIEMSLRVGVQREMRLGSEVRLGRILKAQQLTD